MLHVFNVNKGRMLTFEVNLAMERVLELKYAISEAHRIAPEKQVMLISDGQALCDEERVCSYAAGTETNPVYLFDKACIEKETLQMESTYQEGNDFIESIRNARSLAPSYKTVDTRTKLAMRLHDSTRQQVLQMKSLVHDEHLMFQGWQAAVSNLSETVAGFQKRVTSMCNQCQSLFERAKNNDVVLHGMESVLQSLAQIPILPSLLKSGLSGSFISNPDNFQVSLLHWIKAQCKNVPVEAMYNECKQKQGYLSQERYTSLLNECKKVESQAGDMRMSEISGIKERLSHLDQIVIAGEEQVKDQTGIAQGFVRNRDTARELHNNSSSIDALLTLCESHITQLQIMSENETMTRDALHKCMHAKHELAANLHTRLRWLYFVQRSILNADVKLSMFVQQLGLLQQQIEFLEQVKKSPTLYLSALAEVVRRKNFADAYVQWANKAVADARVERDREIVKRKKFQTNISGHFIQKLFHGFSDKPPSLSKKPLRTFDSNLPDINAEHIATLSELLPNYKDILEVSTTETSGITSMTMTHSSIITTSTSTNMQSTQRMDTSAGSPPEMRSMGTSTKDSPTGSFAMVDPSSITQPGGFVVTSVENVRQANLVDEGQKGHDGTHLNDDTILPRRAYSSTTLTSDQAVSPGSTPSDRTDSDTLFAQIGDIISPDSPPDSEFFSIMPGSFGSGGRTPQRGLSVERQMCAPPDSPDGKMITLPTSPRKQSMVKVGSLESNSSTSYQKVDGLSSDEEMFHSFTSEQQDVKMLRKKLHQVQTQYDKVTEAGKIEKEELNTLIGKLNQEISLLKENQAVVEKDFEKRWGESKSELDNIMKQLENERLERKKAWTEGALLEKKLKAAEEEFHTYKTQIANLQSELNSKTLMVQNLETDLSNCKTEAETALAQAEEKLSLATKDKEDTSALYKSMSTKLEKELSLAQAELSTAEDRIQDLETMLSEHERKQQEDAVQLESFEARVHELNRELNVARESQLKSTYETNEAHHKITDAETKLQRANEQIFSLKTLLADYETKLEDDKKKDILLKNLKSSLNQSELDKLELQSNITSAEKEIENLTHTLAESQNELAQARSVATQDAKSHQDEIEKLTSSHREELQICENRYGEELRTFTEKHENDIQGIIKDNEILVSAKEEEWRLEEERIKASHRNELDELEADRLESVASSQQTIEDLREKLRENSRVFEQERKESIALKDSMVENSKRMEEEYARVLQENETLSSSKSDLEDRLLRAEEEISTLQERAKEYQATESSLTQSVLTSSTDEEMESKRSKMDSGVSDEMMHSSSSSSMENRGSVSVGEHKKAIDVMKKNFEEDKRALKNLFKKREEDSAKRRQMIFNSAIQRVTTSKDLEIKSLRDQLMAQSQMLNPLMTQSMQVTPPQPMAMSLTQAPVSIPSPPFTPIQTQPTTRADSPSETASGRNREPVRDRDRAAVTNFQVGDTVLICFNEQYQHFTLLTTSKTLYFVHHESLEKLGINAANPEVKKTMTFATLTDKEYCQARKSQNRFHVPINTKFYRVKVAPLLKKVTQP